MAFGDEKPIAVEVVSCKILYCEKAIEVATSELCSSYSKLANPCWQKKSAAYRPLGLLLKLRNGDDRTIRYSSSKEERRTMENEFLPCDGGIRSTVASFRQRDYFQVEWS